MGDLKGLPLFFTMNIKNFITDKTVINCETEIEAELLMRLLSNSEYKWIDGELYSECKTYWHLNGNQTTYWPSMGTFSTLEYFEEWDANFKIIKFSDLILKKSPYFKDFYIPNFKLKNEYTKLHQTKYGN